MCCNFKSFATFKKENVFFFKLVNLFNQNFCEYKNLKKDEGSGFIYMSC